MEKCEGEIWVQNLKEIARLRIKFKIFSKELIIYKILIGFLWIAKEEETDMDMGDLFGWYSGNLQRERIKFANV